MDCRNGKIYVGVGPEAAPPSAQEFLREIDVPLTPRQKLRMRIGRNDRCPCGSGKKFKKCCMMPIARGEVQL